MFSYYKSWKLLILQIVAGITIRGNYYITGHNTPESHHKHLHEAYLTQHCLVRSVAVGQLNIIQTTQNTIAFKARFYGRRYQKPFSSQLIQRQQIYFYSSLPE